LLQNARLISPLLYDPARAVRMEAARALAALPVDQLQPPAIVPVFESALEEFVAAGLYSADFPEGQYNLGNLYGNMERAEEAERHYRGAIGIDPTFYPAMVNLAMLLNRQGRNDEAADQLRLALEIEPGAPQVEYNLGLLLAEMERFAEAAGHLERAADGMPGHTRVLYNLGLVEQRLGRNDRAAAALDRALAIEPENGEYLYTAAWLASMRSDFDAAEDYARRMTANAETREQGRQLLEAIDQARRSTDQ
jgi:Tfp pilus assembly protein PilF